MLNKLGKKICAGVGAFITVFGSNALSNAMQTKEKAIQNAAGTAGNVNRNSGGYSRNGAILSPRTLLELLVGGGGIWGYGKYKNRSKNVNDVVGFQDQIDKLNEEKDELTKEKNKLIGEKDELTKEKNKLIGEKNQFNKEKDELTNEFNQLINEIKEREKGNIDAKKLGIFFEFLHDYVCPVNYLTGRDEYWLNNWSNLDTEKYKFIPYSVGENYYSIVGNLNLKRFFIDHEKNFKLSTKYKTKKEKWDLNLDKEDIECISKAAIPLGALERASIHKGYNYSNQVLSSDLGLDKYNSNCSAKWDENCKRVFSKINRFNYDQGYVLCEGFITEYGKNTEGLVVRLTYGELVKNE